MVMALHVVCRLESGMSDTLIVYDDDSAGVSAACLASCSLYLFSLMPNSTFNTVLLKEPMVRPSCFLMRDSHPSGRRSSIKIDSKSSTRPPKMVRSVEELCEQKGMRTSENLARRKVSHFELPKTLWKVLSVKFGLLARASTLRLAE